VARNTRSVRLVLALSVAAVLAVFLLYVSIAGGRTPQLRPSQLGGHHEKVSLVGKVKGPVRGTSYSSGGMRFWVKDVEGHNGAKVPVVYHGSVPDLFAVGRHVVINGRLRQGVFVAQRDTLVTKCPSKYSPKKS
jgi:cytochrome c-type biogenesis protein CcmE